MNPLLQEALGAFLRWLFAGAAGWFVSRGIWTEEAATTYVAAAALGVLSLAWSLWAKYKNRLKLVTALDEPRGSTEEDVEYRIACRRATVPAVTTPKDLPPAA